MHGGEHMEACGGRDMVGDAAGLLLVIDRLGRTIAELEARNAALEQQLQAAAAIKCGCVPLNLDPKPGTPIPEVPQ